MFVNILVAIDGSTYAAKALDYAIGLAEKFPAKINIVHVVPTMTAIFHNIGPATPQCVKDMQTGLENEGKNILAEGEKTVKLANIDVTPILKFGDVADEILDAATEVKADLIVVGERGLGLGGRIRLGSIAYTVSQHSKCPILIIK